MLQERQAGLLLHLTSFPGGRLGSEARRVIEWMAEAGLQWLQLLPIQPPDPLSKSPFMPQSAFAGYPRLLEHPLAEVDPEEVEGFQEEHSYWIEGWERFAGPTAVADQVRFWREWQAFRQFCDAYGVRLFGDMPFYVAPGSADHRSYPHLFLLEKHAGVPPDDFEPEHGQDWGNPLYSWEAMEQDGFRWMIERFRWLFQLYDLLRSDHFRAFQDFWAILDGQPARNGCWMPGPGRRLFDAVLAVLGRLPLVAEDLGTITPDVIQLRDGLGLPGMAVMQFARNFDPNNLYRLEHHHPNQVVYVGTHDNPTASEFWCNASDDERSALSQQMTTVGVGETTGPVESLMWLALGSPGNLAIVTAQDVLGLGPEGCMNRPGTSTGNWSWQLEPGQLTAGHARRLRMLCEMTGRI